VDDKASSALRFALRFDTNVRVMGKHFRRNVPGDGHYGLVASLRFGKLSNCVVAQIMKPESSSWAFDLAKIGFASFVFADVMRILLQAAHSGLPFRITRMNLMLSTLASPWS